MSMMIGPVIIAAVQYWPLVVVPLVCAGMLVYRCICKLHAARLLAGKRISLLMVNFSSMRLAIKTVLMIMGITMLWISLMRPQWTKREQVVTQEGRDVLIALDVSGSMHATDCPENRLAFAKAKIKSLLAQLSSERVGLILFSSSAFVQCPLTSDYGAFSLFLQAVDVETISAGSTVLDQAIGQAVSVFERSPDRKNKLLLIMTDGEDFSCNLEQMKIRAKEQGVQIFACGVGTAEGAPIPLYDERGVMTGHQKDQQGNVVISRLNEQLLSVLVQDVGGLYVRLSPGNKDIRHIVRAVERFEKERIAEKKYAQYEDQYHYCLLITFFCFLIEWLL